MVLPKYLNRHLGEHTILSDCQLTKSKREKMVSHILAKYSLSLDQAIPPRATWILPHANPYLGDIIEAKKCPFCLLPYDNRTSMTKHIKNLHKSSTKWRKPLAWQNLPKVNTQWAFKTTCDKKYLCTVRDSSLTSQPPSTTHDLGKLPPISSSSSPVIPNFYQALYWTHWMDKIKGNETWTSSLMKAVFGLVELPSEAKIKGAAKDLRRKKLETGLLRVHKALKSYLSSADVWLDTYHHSLREKLKGR